MPPGAHRSSPQRAAMGNCAAGGGVRNSAGMRQVPQASARVLRFAHFPALRFFGIERVGIDVRCPNRWDETKTCNYNYETKGAHCPGHLGSVP